MTGSSEWGEWGPPPPPQQQYSPYPPPPPATADQQGYYSAAPPAEAGAGGAPQGAYDVEAPSAPAGPLVRLASAGSGGAVALGLSKAISGRARPSWAGAGAGACVVAGLSGGRFGEAALALGATTVGTFRASRRLADGRYPVFRQFKAGLGLVPREMFPPRCANPWQYRKEHADEADFSMAQSLVAACAMSGLAVNVAPLPSFFPTSLCATLAAGCGLFAVTLRDARGDAARCLCARFVASIKVALAAAGDAELGAKSMSAARLGGLRLNALDSKLGVSKTLSALFSKAVEQAASASSDSKAASGPNRQTPRGRRRPSQPAYGEAPPPPPQHPPQHPPPQQPYQQPYASDPAESDWGLPPSGAGDYYR